MSYTEIKSNEVTIDLLAQAQDSITSLDLCKQINIFREQEGRSELKHYDLLKVIRDEFEEEIGQGKISSSEYLNSQGKQQPMYILTLSQAKQVLVREHKTVRRAVIKYIEILEEKLASQTPVLTMEQKAILELHATGGMEAVLLGKQLQDIAYERGQAQICDNGIITIQDIFDMIKEEYPEEWKYFIREPETKYWTKYLKHRGCFTMKQYPQAKDSSKMERKYFPEPTESFQKAFVDKGYAAVRIVDSREKYVIKYTRKIKELIKKESFRQSFFTYFEKYERDILYIKDDILCVSWQD